MTVKIVIEPRKIVTWEEFVASTPPKSIALDGFVFGGPKWDPTTPHANFDHHSAKRKRF